ncbi:MAG: hypothetical protein JWN64_295 [Parcubacteria group bacterium]|nr:hypothetical protein [Parcubacteria group bacterium]
MKRHLIILAAVVLVVLAIGILIWVGITLFKKESVAPVVTNNDPFGGLVTSGTGGTTKQKAIHDRSGQVVSVPDFTESKEPLQTPNGVYYQLYGPEYSTQGFTFSVQYGENDSEFLITLISEPLRDARSDAETYMRTLLKLTDAQLCALNTSVVVQADVNELYSEYDNLGLSFCEGSVNLP